jgi:hypothetical protein
MKTGPVLIAACIDLAEGDEHAERGISIGTTAGSLIRSMWFDQDQSAPGIDAIG